jgi:hypothetical protein
MTIEDLLCDACLYKVENEVAVQVQDFCKRCQRKVIAYILDAEGLAEADYRYLDE